MGFVLIGIKPKTERGKRFRNNVWWWRRLWILVSVTCHFLSETDIKEGWFNDGHKIDEHKANKIGHTLKQIINGNKITKAYLEDLTFQYLEVPEERKENYLFDWENVNNFADFCIDSGGFEIW